MNRRKGIARMCGSCRVVGHVAWHPIRSEAWLWRLLTKGSLLHSSDISRHLFRKPFLKFCPHYHTIELLYLRSLTNQSFCSEAHSRLETWLKISLHKRSLSGRKSYAKSLSLATNNRPFQYGAKHSKPREDHLRINPHLSFEWQHASVTAIIRSAQQISMHSIWPNGV
jgi:hypothetical protein